MIKTLGIIGGGQLAVMLIQSASKLGIKVNCLDPNSASPAGLYASTFINKDFDDVDALKELCQLSDYVIYEFENVNLTSLQQVDQSKLYQGIEILKASQNRLCEKALARKFGLKTADYRAINNVADLEKAQMEIGYPAIVKTTELGYDGKGQVVLKSANDLPALDLILSQELIYEQMLDFAMEISIIAIRNKAGEVVVFPPFINEHKNGILHQTSCFDPKLDREISQKAIDLTKHLVNEFDYHGILCIEFFVKDKEIYFNEMAPRPHNSGHVSMDAYQFSQFDLMIIAVAGLKLSEPKLLTEMTMFNILGQDIDKTLAFCQQNPGAKLYLYGKDSAKTNRKMGHINVCVDPNLINKLKREVFNNE